METPVAQSPPGATTAAPGPLPTGRATPLVEHPVIAKPSCPVRTRAFSALGPPAGHPIPEGFTRAPARPGLCAPCLRHTQERTRTQPLAMRKPAASELGPHPASLTQTGKRPRGPSGRPSDLRQGREEPTQGLRIPTTSRPLQAGPLAPRTTGGQRRHPRRERPENPARPHQTSKKDSHGARRVQSHTNMRPCPQPRRRARPVSHPFTAPMITPLVKWRCTNGYSTSTGTSAITTEASANAPTLMFCPCCTYWRNTSCSGHLALSLM